ncbi:heme NO-binding domain-containing protein [Rhodoferax sp. BAB1]|uniref:heme NO-binding domain-containing protein n=1 Tax=Rhodoferax sp. BAB1 TaxID=2741720 RepID=UPI0015770A1A|nr:heme NO-binding domain-containing protein [Rhodoferax sp. BAB1]QKO21707.1 heme NO-binding domain-containing protein [Rhodoferax sp. BAB1]
MYGLVNRAIEQLVIASKGDIAWERVCLHAGISSDGFIAMCPYDDDITYRLVEAVSVELSITQTQVLEAFGEYWVLYTADEGYGELLDAGGNDLREFLGNLNLMHGRVEGIFTQMKLPRFRVEDIRPGEFLLHYDSERPTLAPMVIGLVRGLAKRFRQTVHVERLLSAGDIAPGHAVFMVIEKSHAQTEEQ